MSEENNEWDFSPEEYAEYVEALEQFEEQFLVELAGTERFQLVPMVDEEGDYLTEEALTAIKQTCKKNGLVIIYYITKVNQENVFYCPATGKTAVVCDGLH